MSRSSNEVTSFLLFLSVFSQPLYTLVNLCQPCPRDGKIKGSKFSAVEMRCKGKRIFENYQKASLKC